MKRVIFINRYFYPDHSATSQMLSDLVFSLASETRADLTVITSRQRYDDPLATLPKAEKVKQVKIIRVWTSRFGRGNLLGRAIDYITFYLSVLFTLLIKTGKNDTIVAKTDPPMISVICAVCSKINGFTLVNWSQDLFPEVGRALNVKFLSGRLYKPLLWLRNWSLLCANHNVAIGENMMLKLQSYGVPKKSIHVIHNWSNAIAPIEKKQNKLREKWGYENEFVVGYSGNLGRGHDVETIITTINELRSNANIKFLFVGGGAKIDELRGRLISLENVSFKAYQPRELLSESLSVPDAHLISLLPELEGFMVPSKFYGVIAAGKPVIFVGDPSGEIPKIIKQHDCGITVRNNDSVQLSEEILKLSTHPEKVFNMGLNGRKTFNTLFRLDAVLPKWKVILD